MKEKIKAATCVSFSHDGKFLAVGEVRHAASAKRSATDVC
jgi:hypothetical protein